MTVKDLLKQSKFRIYNIEIAKKIGVNQCLVLMQLADAEEYFKSSDSWFYTTYEEIADNTALSTKQIGLAVSKLRDIKVIQTEMRDIPSRMHFYLNVSELERLMGVFQSTTKGGRCELPKGVDVNDERELIYNKEHKEKTKNKEHINVHFDVFWDLYDKKANRIASEKKWNSFTDELRNTIMEYLPKYIASTPVKKYRKDPMSFFNQQAWKNEIIKDNTDYNYNIKTKLDDFDNSPPF